MNITKIIALNLKEIRNERQLTLDQLTQLTGISKGMLSQIEKGDTNPTINTIWKICDGLNIPYTYLLEEKDKPKPTIVSKEKTLYQSADNDRYRVFCYYSDTIDRNFELFQVEMDLEANYTSIGHSKKSDEYLMVLEGTLTLTTNEQTLTLSANEAISFKAETPHTYQNLGSFPIKVIVINFYPL